MSELQVFEMSFASYLFIMIVIFLNSDVFFFFFNIIIVQIENSLYVVLVEQPVMVLQC